MVVERTLAVPAVVAATSRATRASLTVSVSVAPQNGKLHETEVEKGRSVMVP